MHLSDVQIKKLNKTLKILAQEPFYPSLHTHKVISKNFGEQYSSRVTGDIRIIWCFHENHVLTLLVLDIGTHSGSHRVYT